MNSEDLNNLKSNLPQTPGIMNRQAFFNSAVLIPLVEIDGEYHLLFEKRAADIRQGGEISFPGGQIDETDRDSVHTAVRETIEELGINESKIEIFGRTDIMVGRMGVIVEPVLGFLRINSIEECEFDKAEVERIFTVPIAHFRKNPAEEFSIFMVHKPYFKNKNGEVVETFPVKDLKIPPKYAKPWGMREQKVFVWRVGGETIWGITAEIIKDVLRLLDGSEANNIPA